MEMTRMPVPVLDARERQLLAQLGEPYRRTPRRGKKSRTQEKEHRLAAAMLRAAGRGFARLQGEAARQMMSEAEILAAVRKTSGLAVYSAREVCFVRSYAVSRALRQCWTGHLRRALWQGSGTGLLGLAGLPFQLVLGLFLSFRAVQTTALFYGFDPRNRDWELTLAGQVFLAAAGGGEGPVQTFLSAPPEACRAALAQLTARTDALTAQMQAAGQRGMEQRLFQELLEQFLRRVVLRDLGRWVPVAGAAVGAVTEADQMRRVLRTAEAFYHKRFLVEKEQRCRAQVKRAAEQRQ